MLQASKAFSLSLLLAFESAAAKKHD